MEVYAAETLKCFMRKKQKRGNLVSRFIISLLTLTLTLRAFRKFAKEFVQIDFNWQSFYYKPVDSQNEQLGSLQKSLWQTDFNQVL